MDPVRSVTEELPKQIIVDIENVERASPNAIPSTSNGVEIFRTCTILIIVSFVAHFVWEYFHFGFYTGYEHWSGSMPVYWLATVGDVLYTLGAFALVSAIKKSYEWISSATVSDYFMLVTLGCLIALFVEYKGLALDRWEYRPEMPLIPMLGVGLSPILQMAILLPVTFFVTQWLSARFSESKPTY